jgi:diguanylate cyclase
MTYFWLRVRSRIPRIANPRIRIMVWAVFITLIFGAIEFGEPVEDMLKGTRDALRSREASGDIVVVGVDDKTARELNGFSFPRSYDAKLVDTLFAQGATSVYFDRVYSGATTTVDDTAFAAALARHKGKVFLGASSNAGPGTPATTTYLPLKMFRDVAGFYTLNAFATPFSISFRISYGESFEGQRVSSLSAALAGKELDRVEYYRPDWSLPARSITTYSFVDIVKDRTAPGAFEGKKVIVGPTSEALNDVHQVIFQGWVPGVYFHVIGAETLKRGIPVYWGWLPAFLVGLALAAINLFSNPRWVANSTIVAAVFILGVTPLFFDASLITLDVMPASVLFAIVAYRAMTLRRVLASSRTNVSSGLANLSALRSLETKCNLTLIALKVRNLPEIASSFDQIVERAVIDELRRRIEITDLEGEIYHSEDTLLWLTKLEMGPDLAGHIEGLNGISKVPLRINGRMVDLSLAFGVDGDIERSMTSRVGSAMLTADESARANELWRFYDPQRRHEAVWQLSMLSRLDQAIDTGEIWVAFQAKLDIPTGRIVGAEALVRWNHPERGVIGPDEFIVAAERHNRIEKLTMFVLDQAVSAAAQINARGIDFSAAVNLSTQLLQHHNLLDLIEKTLDKHKLPAHRLILEITETGQLDRNGPSIVMMERLAEHGIHVSIDDYGTGNATLDYLKILPSDEVKIDRQFIANIDTSSEDRILVGSTIAMVHSLGRRVVAEGVETKAVLDELALLGCDTAQGYLIGRPVRFPALVRSILGHETQAA